MCFCGCLYVCLFLKDLEVASVCVGICVFVCVFINLEWCVCVCVCVCICRKTRTLFRHPTFRPWTHHQTWTSTDLGDSADGC